MKLAEALIQRADHQKRIQQLKDRLVRNAKIQEGEPPAEEPAGLLEEFERVAGELVQLIRRINKTNAATEFEPGVTISDALATRDTLQLKQAAYRDLAKAATVTQDRSTRSEVKFKSALSVSDAQQKADQYAREHRELDARIQEANWSTELSD
jgi:hypothetical protein